MICTFQKILMTVVLVVFSHISCQAAAGPREQLQSTVDEIIATLGDENIPIETRRQQLAEKVQSRFDLEAISQWVLGPYWRRADERERERFVELFPELIKAAYLGRIEGYQGEKVLFVDEQIDGKRALVESYIQTESAEIPVDYKLVNRDGQWLIYDLIIENVSLVRNYRSTYTEIARKEGIKGLLRQMERKIEELRSNPPEEDGELRVSPEL